MTGPPGVGSSVDPAGTATRSAFDTAASGDLARTLDVLHDINFAPTHSDRIVVAMRDGRVVADAPADLIRRADVLELVTDTQVEVREIDCRPVALYYS
ncbi:hypothetical protein E3O42_03365 [Cryobacterium adonitolivorans]|uniref:Uncharacterized protein n=1 Tax=Cryobacterium adonitolivorans TaxID=1259189 RepID=A0A4R8WA90_9MICO|nr:hypothetical protein [Cryobacterium adonitolivorans]TFC05600.1 hypothetical protein E3O42_03365 [Cryobacterium adonitolivorans]